MNYLMLQQRQLWDLNSKILHSKQVIKQWYDFWDGNVYVSFSGGKDSTVLLHLVRTIYPDVKAVFLNTRVEYPEIIKFVHSIDNVETIFPTLTFRQVIEKYGYPVISKEQSQYIHEIKVTKSEYLLSKRLGKNKNCKEIGALSKKWHYLINSPIKISDLCCTYLKKNPIIKFEKVSGLHPILGIKAEDSRLRMRTYIQNEGCTTWKAKRPLCLPLSIWTEKDIWDYIKLFNVPYSSIYNKGYNSTGCVLCLFGAHLKNPNTIQLLSITHPKLWQYAMDKLNYKEVCEIMKIPTKMPFENFTVNLTKE